MTEVIDFISKTSQPRTDEDEFRRHEVPVYLWPSVWKRLCFDQVPLWRTARFGYDSTTSVPIARGIYAFRIRIASFSVPDNGVIAYFGTSGKLRNRYRDYISEKKRGAKRPKIRRLFELWGDELDFVYWVVGDRSCSLKPLEAALNSVVMTPFVTKDLTARAREIKAVL